MRKMSAARSVILLFLACVTAFGCIVPSVFHDTWRKNERQARPDGVFCCFSDLVWEATYSRNRLTGDILRGPIRWR